MTKLRSLAISSSQNLSSSSHRSLLHSSPHFHIPVAVHKSIFNPLFNSQSQIIKLMFQFPLPIFRRYASSKERKRKPVTGISTKKKIKMKAYSSYKLRFRTLNDGQIRRWREGKRHNAHLKSKKSKRRLRQPALVHAAYAKVMKKLNFCG
ncbi:hypothetical protein GIB67_040909 [Kingdonia uniflora]|uniref:50S ribosomal protein L35 n=1 Tax=Kingdonia uniflora TaxID=39325 RepID=A0A7J7L808_9MAGN|nr:hypothetical protein GIB67_040909 [Kingdonia uniflora]